VAWVYAPQATSWAGYTSSEHWYETNHTDLAAVEVMLSKAIQSVGAANSDAAAWNNIFTYFNTNHGKPAVGYQTGEKIAIKINLVTCSGRFGSAAVDIYGTYEKQNSYGDGHWLNTIDPSPQMLLSLLRQLVYNVGVDPTNIFIGDPTANFPKYLWDRLHPEFPGVNYFDNFGGAGRIRFELSTVPFYWSVTNKVNPASAYVQDYIPVPFVQADYLIDFAVMKSHSGGGISVCGKNFFGSLLRCPDGYSRDAGGKDVGGVVGGYSDMHYGLPNSTSLYGGVAGLGHYRPQVDLLGHRSLGGKVVLYFVDALYCGQDANAQPYQWNMAPFNGNWPSSVFASQDPVAIDSVCYDFLVTEWPSLVNASGMGGGAEDYLYEAAQANNPPSGTFYDPTKSGTHLASLGVHEHWNDAVNKQYTRNLDPVHGQGIELVQLTATRPKPALALAQAGTNVLVSWPAALNTFSYSVWLQSRTNLAALNSWSNVPDVPGFDRGSSVVTNPAQGIRFYRLFEQVP
jgi:hypothetical protein